MSARHSRVETIRYDITPQGVMVEVVHTQPAPAEWTSMMRFMVNNAARIQSVLVVNDGDHGPTAVQRDELKQTLTHLRPNLPVAILTDSRIARAVMTAILWITGKHAETAVLALSELGKAVEFLRLDQLAQAEVRTCIARLRE